MGAAVWAFSVVEALGLEAPNPERISRSLEQA
jgi:hypothetical protein